MTVVKIVKDNRMEMCDRCDSVKLIAKPCPQCGKRRSEKETS